MFLDNLEAGLNYLDGFPTSQGYHLWYIWQPINGAAEDANSRYICSMATEESTESADPSLCYHYYHDLVKLLA